MSVVLIDTGKGFSGKACLESFNLNVLFPCFVVTFYGEMEVGISSCDCRNRRRGNGIGGWSIDRHNGLLSNSGQKMSNQHTVGEDSVLVSLTRWCYL